MEKNTIKRDGLPPLAFIGTKIGRGSNANGNRANRWTVVTIWKTKGGRYIAHVERHTCGESGSSEATAHGTAAEVIAALASEDGPLGPVSQEAVEEATRNDPAFAAAWVVKVE